MTQPRLAAFERDGWQLRSGEQSHRDDPDTFRIPPAQVREHLQRGQVARLIIDYRIEGEDPPVQGERVWVIVSEKVGTRYIGLLMHDPQLIETGDNLYLCGAAEIPFDAEHIIDTDDASTNVTELMFSEPPTRLWFER